MFCKQAKTNRPSFRQVIGDRKSILCKIGKKSFPPHLPCLLRRGVKAPPLGKKNRAHFCTLSKHPDLPPGLRIYRVPLFLNYHLILQSYPSLRTFPPASPCAFHEKTVGKSDRFFCFSLRRHSFAAPLLYSLCIPHFQHSTIPKTAPTTACRI